MTEKEAIKELKNYRACGGTCFPTEIDMAISALEEIQQYREIGTVEECRAAIDIIKKAERNELARIIDEWLAYHKIGTVEECRAAVEKQKPKKPDCEGDGYADGHIVYDTWICPNCGKRYEVDYDDYDFCPNCGQALDWGDEQ